MRYRKIRFYSKQHGETAGLVIQHDGKTFHSIEELSRLFPMHEALKMQKFQFIVRTMSSRHHNKGEASMYKPKHRYTDRELVYASLRDLVTDIRCARRDHCAANPLLGYAERCIAEFRALWSNRHCH